MAFKIGDKVKKIGSSDCQSAIVGEIYTVTRGGNGMGIGKDKNRLCSCIGEWELVVNQSNMNLKEKFLLVFKSEPQKSFRQKGITNGDDMLTEEGQAVFLTWLLQKHADDFKKEVVDNIENEK